MKIVKYRVDFSAHHSIVVSVPESENDEDEAIKLAEKYITNIVPDWEMDDGGIEEADEDEEPENYLDVD